VKTLPHLYHRQSRKHTWSASTTSRLIELWAARPERRGARVGSRGEKSTERRVRFPHQQTFAGPADVSHLAHQPASSIGAQIPR